MFDRARVEPTDASMVEAIEFARSEGPFDAIVAIGGGSSIDTAKAVNLLVTNDGDLMDYVNAPVGAGAGARQPAAPARRPSDHDRHRQREHDDLRARRPRPARQDRHLAPAAASDPRGRRSRAHAHAAGRGHRCRRVSTSCATRWRATPRAPTRRTSTRRADERVPYCGSNPIADMWSEQALMLMSGAFRTAVHDGKDLEARTQVAMAATFAGLGFGNAGVHIPHANAYPIAGQVRDFRPDGLRRGPRDGAARHGRRAHRTGRVRLHVPGGPRTAHARGRAAVARLDRQLGRASGRSRRPPAAVLTGIMREVGIPSGLAEVGYGSGDIDALVEGTMKQQRLLATAPREVTEDDVAGILDESIELW